QPEPVVVDVAVPAVLQLDPDVHRVVERMPLDRLLIETDAPWLAPQAHRGDRNEPTYVRFVAEKVAELRGMAFDEVARQTTDNAIRLFGLTT
ncbi:TatD family hydrolase, partial [Patescibacteria group bacterium]|nr:TatD family hydrolase [Patescibacteria group bacterium]MBU1448378.1 TatD family hydrolase [Patescibacteria group bacterium]